MPRLSKAWVSTSRAGVCSRTSFERTKVAKGRVRRKKYILSDDVILTDTMASQREACGTPCR